MMNYTVADGGYIDFKNNKIDIENKFYILQIDEIFSGENLKRTQLLQMQLLMKLVT